jgi:tRNA modification GTPase
VNLGDTIVACATGRTRAARAVVRASGPDVPALAGILLGWDDFRPGVSTPRLALPCGGLPVIAMAFCAPRSYTGEHVLELLMPGHPHLIRCVLEACTAAGARPAGPGEFSARAVVNARLSLEQAEGVAGVIAAATRAELDAARRVLDGHAGREFHAWADRLTTLLALVEAGIDFSDQDGVVAITPRDLLEGLTAVIGAMRERLAGAHAGESRPHAPRVLLAGPPNAGKSTLFNALLGRRRSIVAPLRGTTRDIIEEPLELHASAGRVLTVMLADTPGLDERLAAGGQAERSAQNLVRRTLNECDVILWCRPAHHGPAHSRQHPPFPDGVPVVTVRTMADLPALRVVMPSEEPEPAIPVCAIDGWNLHALRTAVFDACWRCSAGPGRAGTKGVDSLWPRHHDAVARAAARLEELRVALSSHADSARLDHAELIAGSLRDALDALGELTGHVARDDVLGRIFATFCIGK